MANKDDTIDRLLTAMHGRPGNGPSPDCLDAETLAAWMDHQLGGPALARAEAHAAGCGHCQALLSAMARTADAGAEAHPGAGAPRSRGWRILPWAVPLAAAATAAGLYLAVGPLANQSVRTPAVTIHQPAAAGKDADLQPPAAPGESAPAVGGSARNRERKAEVDSRVRADQPATRAEERPGRDLIPAPADEQEKFRAQAANAAAELAQAQLADAVVPAPLPRVGEIPRSAAQPVSERPAQTPPRPPAVAPQPSAPASAQATQRQEARSAIPVTEMQKSAFASQARVDIFTPDPAIRWRIVGGTVVQFTSDQGKTWTAQDVRPASGLTAGTAPSATVCWIVGRAGTVLRTIDGRTWHRVSFPEPADLVTIVARSAEIATVTTADGRTFTTADGGKTWGPLVP